MEKFGISGRIARQFLTTEITPLLALVGLLLGLFAVAITPREEEPQINVTFANVFVPFPGASAKEVESLIASPAEQVLSEIDGIKHELSTLPNVLEDVTDIVLNLKEVVVRCHAHDTQTIKLDARGPGVVTAGDLKLTSNVEVINPDLVYGAADELTALWWLPAAIATKSEFGAGTSHSPALVSPQATTVPSDLSPRL